MEDGLKKLTTELAAELTARLADPEFRAAIEATQRAADSDAGTFEVVISTENVDRYQEIISLGGWELDHYRNNPVVLWGHDMRQLPIGIATDIVVRDGKLIATGKFAVHEFAQTVRKLYDAGVLRATSVGFIEKEREGNLITKAELIEFSFVSVPANPFALSTMVKDGVNVNDMVTKGLVFVEKEAEPESPETPENEPTPEEQPTDEPETAADEAETPAKDLADLNVYVTLSNQQYTMLLQNLKDATIALEALAQKDEVPEGNEAPEEEDEEVRKAREFSSKRRTLQEASTILAAVLAEARQAINAQKGE